MHHACDYLGHIFHEGCIKQALRAQMHNNGLYHILRTHLNTPSPTETGTFLRGELVSPEGRCLLCRTSVQGVMKVYLPKPRLAAKVEEKFKKIREGMAQLRQKVYSSAIRIIKLKRDKERLRKQRGQLLDELEDVMDELDEIKKENELIILDCRPCQQNTPENKTTRTTSGGMAPNTD